MENVKVVIGANFGDEGKGLMTDYFCRQFGNSPVLNIRFNGGAQAGHTVVTDDGKRHVFNHFGSGSFNKNVDTYFAKDAILNPILFRQEYEALKSLGVCPKFFANENCRVTIPLDMMMNQIVERKRGNGRHGSCGVGIFETIKRCFSPLSINFLCVGERFCKPMNMDTLLGINKEYLPMCARELKISLDDDDLALVNNPRILHRYLEDFEFMIDHINVTTDGRILPDYENVVFEGAQGLLLDKDNLDYFPHLTPSYTGMHGVQPILRYNPYSNLEVCYVSRTYFTRHGAGRFDTETARGNLDSRIEEKTNITNEFQGNFRFGYFDIQAYNQALTKDMKFLPYGAQVSQCFTHVDQTDGIVLPNGKYLTPADIRGTIILSGTGYISCGETAADVSEL